MASPYGGDRGGGRKSSRKRGGQPGNVNRRASKLLPRATDTEDRRAFLDALDASESMSADEQVRILRDLGFARCLSQAELMGVPKLMGALATFDHHRRVQHRVDGNDDARKREALKDQALGEVWQSVSECERCSEAVDRLLVGLELALRQLGGVRDEQWLERANEDTE